jgi:hypothetical protein
VADRDARPRLTLAANALLGEGAAMDDNVTAQLVPAAAARGEYVRRLIASRCPELPEIEVADAMSNSAATTSDVQPTVLMVDREVGEKILLVIEGLDQRLSRIEDWISVEGQA